MNSFDPNNVIVRSIYNEIALQFCPFEYYDLEQAIRNLMMCEISTDILKDLVEDEKDRNGDFNNANIDIVRVVFDYLLSLASEELKFDCSEFEIMANGFQTCIETTDNSLISLRDFLDLECPNFNVNDFSLPVQWFFSQIQYDYQIIFLMEQNND